jgi:salicylate hydroxylase
MRRAPADRIAPPRPADAARRHRVIVIGAGIGGLSAALALQRQGLRVSVYEQTQALKEAGAGLVLTPNAIHGLNFLGVGADVTAASNLSRGHQYRHYRTGEVLRRRPAAATYAASHGAGVYYVHRADLHSALLAAVLANDPNCVYLDHTFSELSQDKGHVRVRFANGAAVEGDVLIGADGCRSAVREALHGREPIAYMGQIAFRALIPRDRLSDNYDFKRSMYLGPGRLFLAYPLRKTALVNIVALVRQKEWQDEGWTTPAERAELAEMYGDFVDGVRSLINAIKPGTLFKWGLHDRPPLESWSRGRATLLGDAAHPMSPFLGQGAALAIEDGVVLARCFAKASNTPQALQLYEQARRPRANAAQRHSRTRADALQRTFVEDFDTKRNAEDTRLLNALFAYNPATTPLEQEVSMEIQS